VSERIYAVVALAIVGLALLGIFMLTTEAWKEKQIDRKVDEAIAGLDRFIDVGVTLARVVQDDAGCAFVEGKPRLRVVETRHLGWLVDTKSNPPTIARASANHWRGPYNELPPAGVKVWYASSDQWDAVFHDDDVQLGQLVYGSEGAGKTRALAMWHYVRWLEAIFEGLPSSERREGGQTAPTTQRLAFIREQMMQLYSADWYRYSSSDETFTFCEGTRIKLVSTYRQSKAQGSPIQGFNWSWCGRDEAQDQVDVHEDISSRGRSARVHPVTGIVLYKQMATATAKDDSSWRELRDILLASGRWIKRSLSIFRSPLIAKDFIATKKSEMSMREFKRRYGDPRTGEVDDLLPELAVYYGWDRKRNLVVKPQIAKDVTAAVLAAFGYQSYIYKGQNGQPRGFGILCSHDPGVIFNTTEVQQLMMFSNVPTWVVVGELQTKQTTQREHARQLSAYLRDNFYVNHPTVGGPLALVFVDPHGKGEAQTDYQSVYMAFQGEGLDVFSPASVVGRINRKPRIEMVNRLMGGNADSEGVPRLVIAQVGGRPAAPKLVEAFESLKKRPGDDNPEGNQRKDEDDKTHAPAALAYGLWPFEQEAITLKTVGLALAATRYRQ
jgi:hypothetical protein